MKHTLLALIMLIATPFMGRAQNILRLENNTDNDIYASYAILDKPHNCWVSVGWIKVPKHNSTPVDLHYYLGKVYIHGENRGISKINNWGNADMLCIDEKKDFEIMCPRDVKCDIQKEFSLIDFSIGSGKYIFN